MSEPFASYQNELYLAGLAGQRPDLPIRLDALGLTGRASIRDLDRDVLVRR